MRGVLENREANKIKQGRIQALDLDDQLVLTLQFFLTLKAAPCKLKMGLSTTDPTAP